MLEKFVKNLQLRIDQQELKEAKVRTEVHSRHRRIDILLELSSKIICIENKIYDFPSFEQLEDEFRCFKPTRLVLLAPFLTINTFKNIVQQEQSKFIFYLSYDDLHGMIKETLNAQSINQDTKFILEQYNRNIEERIMANTLGRFNKKALLYVEYANDIEELKESFENNLKEIWRSVKEQIKSIDINCSFENNDHNQGLLIRWKDWKGKDYDFYIWILLYPEDIKVNYVEFRINTDKIRSSTTKQLKENFTKFVGTKLNELNYKVGEDESTLFIKQIPIEKNYIDTILSEFKILRGLKINEIITQIIHNIKLGKN